MRSRVLTLTGRIPVSTWRPILGMVSLPESKPLEDLRQKMLMGWHGAPAGRCVVRVGISTRSMVDIADAVPLITRMLHRTGMVEKGAVERVSVYRLAGKQDQIRVTVRELAAH